MDVIPIHARTAVFLPRDSVRALVKIIDTDEAWKIYEQLWNDAKELSEILPRYEAQVKQIADLNLKVDQSVVLAAETQRQNEDLWVCNRQLVDSMKGKEEELLNLNAKLQAADHHIALGGNKKAPKFSIPIYRREPNDIFNNPVYTIEIMKKTRGEMSPDESQRFSGFHATRTMLGLSYAAEKSFRKIGVSNESIYEKLARVQNDVTALKDEIEPNALGLASKNIPENHKYLN